jgi:hypothetical protein
LCVRRFRKLAAESVRNAETLAQRHERSRALGGMAKAIVREKRRMQEP